MNKRQGKNENVSVNIVSSVDANNHICVYIVCYSLRILMHQIILWTKNLELLILLKEISVYKQVFVKVSPMYNFLLLRLWVLSNMSRYIHIGIFPMMMLGHFPFVLLSHIHMDLSFPLIYVGLFRSLYPIYRCVRVYMCVYCVRSILFRSLYSCCCHACCFTIN